MLKKDLEAEVRDLELHVSALKTEKMMFERDCKKLKDENNDMKRSISEFQRMNADVTSVIDGIIAVKYPEEFERFCVEPRFREENMARTTLKDCPEEFRILFYIKTRFISQPKMNIRF